MGRTKGRVLSLIGPRPARERERSALLKLSLLKKKSNETYQA